MDNKELELLKTVLPDGYEVVNEDLTEGEQSLVAIWDGDDWQHPISQYQTAKQVIDKILVVERARAHLAGTIEVQHKLKMALGIPNDIERAITTAIHASMR